MQENKLNVPIGEIVAEKLSRSRVFENYGLDYCCGGQTTLNDACKEKGIDPQDLVKALVESDAKVEDTETTDWRQSGLTELADHIESTHHTYLKTELPRLNGLMEKVVNAHGERHPELSKVSATLVALTNELTQHLAKEEEILFPIIREMEATGKFDSHCGEIAIPIQAMEKEHNNAGGALADLRTLTSDFEAPADGCTTFQALYLGLSEMEFDIHQHILKESSILFPRAIALEEKLRQA